MANNSIPNSMPVTLQMLLDDKKLIELQANSSFRSELSAFRISVRNARICESDDLKHMVHATIDALQTDLGKEFAESECRRLSEAIDDVRLIDAYSAINAGESRALVCEHSYSPGSLCAECVTNYGVVIDLIKTGQRSEFAVSTSDYTIVDGYQWSVCPNATRTIPAGLAKLVDEAIRRFEPEERRLGKTWHWHGPGYECGCQQGDVLQIPFFFKSEFDILLKPAGTKFESLLKKKFEPTDFKTIGQKKQYNYSTTRREAIEFDPELEKHLPLCAMQAAQIVSQSVQHER